MSQPAPLRYAAKTPYDHPYDVQFTPRWKWNIAISLLDDHRVFALLPQFATWTKADHQREADYAQLAYLHLHHSYGVIAGLALDTYGNHGSYISGIVRDHFPVETKDTLRSLARRLDREASRSLAHWRAAGRTTRVWRIQVAYLQKEKFGV